MITISNHATRRIRQRVCRNKRKTHTLALAAFVHGESYRDLTGWLKKYVIKTYRRKKTADNIRVHNGFVWLFAGNRLITVWREPLPPWQRRDAKRERREWRQRLRRAA